MPLAAVPGEPRGVEAQNGANLASAQPSHELLKPRPGDGAARRTTEIVIDDLDVAKSASASLVNELILTPLALAVDLHLGLRRLANVETAFLLRTAGGRSSPSIITALLDRDAGGLHQHERQTRYHRVPLGHADPVHWRGIQRHGELAR
jgi:hypothetical protein